MLVINMKLKEPGKFIGSLQLGCFVVRRAIADNSRIDLIFWKWFELFRESKLVHSHNNRTTQSNVMLKAHFAIRNLSVGGHLPNLRTD